MDAPRSISLSATGPRWPRPRIARRAACIGFCVAILILLAPGLDAQQPQQNSPHIGYVYPAGAQIGTTSQVKIGGRFLDGVNLVLVTSRGITTKIIEHNKPMTMMQINDLREKVQALQKKAPSDPAVRKELVDLRLRMGDSLRRNANPMIAEYVTVEMTVAADAEPGLRQIRLATPLGTTEPMVFAVGQLPEFTEKELKETRADTELAITLPATVNGRMVPGDSDRLQAPLRQGQQYAPGDVDRYRFSARKGQELVMAASARELMPYLADAVPGWFQAALTLLDEAGHEIAYDDDFQFQADPVIHCTVPRDGDYVLEVKDALFRGREDFVYRISIGELPYVTGIYPLGGPVKSKTNVEVMGWNLPSNRITMDASAAAAPTIAPLSVHRGVAVSNRRAFALDVLPEVSEKESNDSAKDAQKLATPAIVNGRIAQAGDKDVFRFEGRAGAQLVAEVLARRLGSPLDSSIELTDEGGKRIAFNDDFEDKGAGLVTHQADSYFSTTLPADGTYFLRVSDTQRKGGPEYAYRLRVSPPRPDFDLRVSPSAVSAGAGTTVPLTITAIRKDGFSGDIVVSVKEAPGPFVMSGGTIPSGLDSVRLTLTMPLRVEQEPQPLVLEGRAVVQGKPVVHRAVAAENMMQAFAYWHLVPSGHDLLVSVVQRGAVRVPARLLDAQPIRLPAGGSTRVRVAVPPGIRTFEKLEAELSEPPDGISLRDLTMTGPAAEFVLQADSAKVKAGFRGNLIVTVSGERVPPPNAPAGAVRRRVTVLTLPAIPIEILPR